MLDLFALKLSNGVNKAKLCIAEDKKHSLQELTKDTVDCVEKKQEQVTSLHL